MKTQSGLARAMGKPTGAHGRDGMRGFTLIELLVSMGIGMVILLGLTVMFTSNARVSSAVALRTERMGDLYLASQIMQNELRNAKSGTISWSSNTLSYTDQDGNTGQFQYQYTSNDRIYWKRPGYTNFEEMMRDLESTGSGMTVTSSGTSPKVWTITLKSDYQDENQKTKTLALSFKVWARN
jgi:prepilin-type N-terminal cleavage/methylation domain-containing protein